MIVQHIQSSPFLYSFNKFYEILHQYEFEYHSMYFIAYEVALQKLLSDNLTSDQYVLSHVILRLVRVILLLSFSDSQKRLTWTRRVSVHTLVSIYIVVTFKYIHTYNICTYIRLYMSYSIFCGILFYVSCKLWYVCMQELWLEIEEILWNFMLCIWLFCFFEWGWRIGIVIVIVLYKAYIVIWRNIWLG